MPLLNADKILEKADSLHKKGQFYELLHFLKTNRFVFFFLSKSSFKKSSFLFLYGAALANAGYFKRSLAYLKRSLSGGFPDASEIYYYLILSYINLCDNDKAKYYFSKISERTFSPFFIFLSYYRCLRYKIKLNIFSDVMQNLLPEARIFLLM
jgi:tetratricopeptide (TPR) repeat protein